MVDSILNQIIFSTFGFILYPIEDEALKNQTHNAVLLSSRTYFIPS